MAKAESIVDQIMDLVEEMIERDPEYGDALLALLGGEATQEQIYVLVGLPCDTDGAEGADDSEPEPEPEPVQRRGRGRPAAEPEPVQRRGRGRPVDVVDEDDEDGAEPEPVPVRRGRPPAAAPAPVRRGRR